MSINNWIPLTTYYFNDPNHGTSLVAFENQEYSARKNHTSNLRFNQDFFDGNWSRSNRKLPSIWSPFKLYFTGDVIIFGSIRCTCRYGHESSISFKNDITYSLSSLDVNKLYDKNNYSYFLPWTTISRAWNKNDVVEHNGFLYICISAYNDSSIPINRTYYEPGVGIGYKDKWEIFQLWDPEPLRKNFAPGWMEDIQYLADYLEAVDEVFLPTIDFPIVSLQHLRDISIDTDELTLKNSSEMHGIFLRDFNSKLVDATSFYRYITYLSQYSDESGTDYFLDFINFLIKPDIITGINNSVPIQYRSTTPENSNWIIKNLYTNDYNRFYTKNELVVKYNHDSSYPFLGLWTRGIIYSNKDCVEIDGWIWSSLIDNNINHVPTRSSNYWILVATLSSVDISNFDNLNLLYLNDLNGRGYYSTSRVYLYRSDRMDRIGTNLEQYAEYEGIKKIFYEFAPANVLIYEKIVEYNCTLGLIRIVELGPKYCEIEDCEYIPFICSGKVSYPPPVRIGNWVSPTLGECITCEQKLFVPTLSTPI